MDKSPPAEQQRDWARLDDAGRRDLLTAILAQVSRDALRSQGLDAVLSGIVDCLVARLPVPVASIILLDADGRHFVQEVVAGAFDLDLPTAFPWPVTVGAAGRCARSGEPVLIDDVGGDADYVAGHPSVRAEYLVPIRHAGRVHGVLNLESTRVDLFTPAFRAVFDAIAEQIAGAIHLALVERELEAARRRLAQMSMCDAVTGLGNRQHFDLALAQGWAQARETAAAMALLRIDIDGFAALVEACGHVYGEDCLRELARQCRTFVAGEGDVAARLNNERLALLLPRRDATAARDCGERLREAVAAVRMSHPASARARHVTISVGIGVCAAVRAPLAEYLLRTADRALHQARAEGGDRVVVLET